jgi:hypothetical protein
MLTLDEVLRLVKAETQSAVAEHGAIHSVHESYGLMCEEFNEYFEHVCKKPKKRKKLKMRAELLQIAALCVRSIQDLTGDD